MAVDEDEDEAKSPGGTRRRRRQVKTKTITVGKRADKKERHFQRIRVADRKSLGDFHCRRKYQPIVVGIRGRFLMVRCWFEFRGVIWKVYCFRAVIFPWNGVRYRSVQFGSRMKSFNGCRQREWLFFCLFVGRGIRDDLSLFRAICVNVRFLRKRKQWVGN